MPLRKFMWKGCVCSCVFVGVWMCLSVSVSLPVPKVFFFGMDHTMFILLAVCVCVRMCMHVTWTCCIHLRSLDKLIYRSNSFLFLNLKLNLNLYLTLPFPHAHAHRRDFKIHSSAYFSFPLTFCPSAAPSPAICLKVSLCLLLIHLPLIVGGFISSNNKH